MSATTYLGITLLEEGQPSAEILVNTALETIDDAISGIDTTLGNQAIVVGITASATQTQVGGTALTGRLNIVATCASANNTVTMWAAVAGASLTIVNQGAQTLKVYPASGDGIDALIVDTSTTIVAGSSKRFEAVDGTRWYTVSAS